MSEKLQKSKQTRKTKLKFIQQKEEHFKENQKQEAESKKRIMEQEDVNSKKPKFENLTHSKNIECNLLPFLMESEKLITSDFESLKDFVSEKTLQAINEMGFTTMTSIQFKAIPLLLEGKDLIGYAKTGSGKTLAFLIPTIEMLCKKQLDQKSGTAAIIITPTRELAMQTYTVLRELTVNHSLSHGVVMGGTNRKTEAQKLSSGVNILIATPGRLLDHLQNTSGFMYRNVQCLIIDEVDRILEIGFETEMTQILNILPKKRQTMLFSATQTPKSKMLGRLAFKKEPLCVYGDDSTDKSTVTGLQQGYVVCPTQFRLLFLYSFLKKNTEKKVMVFFSTCNSVEYHYKLLNYIDMPCLRIHGRQKQTKRTKTFYQFCSMPSGILLCTDVAARGLDIPIVDWIVQYDPSDDPKEYIHRVGRTARAGSTGNALLVLMVEELGYLWYLKQAKIPINEYNVQWDKVSGVQSQLEHLVENHVALNKLAREAYRSYLTAYDAHPSKTVFDVTKLALSKVAASFGFNKTPEIELNISGIKGKKAKKKKKLRPSQNGFGFYKNHSTLLKKNAILKKKTDL